MRLTTNKYIPVSLRDDTVRVTRTCQRLASATGYFTTAVATRMIHANSGEVFSSTSTSTCARGSIDLDDGHRHRDASQRPPTLDCVTSICKCKRPATRALVAVCKLCAQMAGGGRLASVAVDSRHTREENTRCRCFRRYCRMCEFVCGVVSCAVISSNTH